MHAVIVANGETPDRPRLDDAWPGWADGCRLVVAADGGALAARRLGFAVDVVVGDADSLPPGALSGLEAAGTEVERWPSAKDASDAELAFEAAVARGAQRITFLGALRGHRLDHEVANVALLWLAEQRQISAVLLDQSTRMHVLAAGDSSSTAARRALPGRAGDLVTLLALGSPADGVVTEGLLYPLRDEALTAGSSRGLSNVRRGTEAHVSLRRGSLLIIETTGGRTEP